MTDLLPIVETGEFVGFVAIQDGDLLLTPLGKTYAEANILARKELIASRILRVPVINWIYETLQQDEDQRVDWEYFMEKFESDYGDRAEKQLDIAITWGRYAELFAYDDKGGQLYLDL